MDANAKRKALRELALKRKADRIPGHKCFGDFCSGAYDQHEYIVPWTISANNVDAEVMIMGQDWNSGEGPLRRIGYRTTKDWTTILAKNE
jgi:hypothetical protein